MSHIICVGVALVVAFSTTGCVWTKTRSEYPDEKLPFPATRADGKTGSVYPVYKDQMIWIKSRTETALIQFTEFTQIDGGSNHECRARYRYRSYNSGTGVETNGAGEVFEKYEVVKTDGVEVTLKDAGSVAEIRAGDIRLAWSFGSKSRGQSWVYVRRGIVDLRILSNKDFEVFEYHPEQPRH